VGDGIVLDSWLPINHRDKESTARVSPEIFKFFWEEMNIPQVYYLNSVHDDITMSSFLMLLH
jgi:hypothetical protein